jgi:hypothetical protein
MKYTWCALALLLAAAPASATIMLEMDLPQIVGQSDAIFVGKAIRTRSQWGPDGKRIVTDTTFQVQQGILGVASGTTVVVRRPGGVVGDIGMRIAGTPVFNKGDEVVVFTSTQKGHRYVVGMQQGVYRIFRDKAGRRTVRARLDGLTLARRTPKGGLKVLDARPARQPRLLGQFVDVVRQTIALCAKETDRCRVP